ncbi:hypothetical protein AAG570_001743 [Ranatra chinensis]|uniref:Tetratricopeptide repeat protein 14 n=1 Tax=Ranatra chinensis TaxID=642074 RepID=A0ABD0YRZ4_9HEMI
MEKVLDSGLITRSLNFHGQQLKKVWETERGEGDLQKLNVDGLDFSVFQERQKHMGFQDRGKRLKLHQFIAKHANVLFDEVLNVRSSSSAPPASPPNEHYAILPPFDMFLDIDKKDRTEHFFSYLKPGDLIMGQLVSKISTGYMMKVLCSDGEAIRIVADLGIKAVIQSVNMIPAVDKKNVTRNFLLNDMVCCEVLEVVANSEKIYAGMKGDVCPPPLRLRLGLIQNEDMPAAYKKWQEGMSEAYDEMLQNSVGFRNPGNIKCLSEELGLGNQNFSHFSSLRFGFPTEECASELRQAQSSKWAYRSVSDGIAHFKAGRHAEAFQCLNKALAIDVNNIEALVARGALYANGGSFKKAIEDFDSALKINSNHQNARKYVAETLVALGRSFEEESKWDEAMAAYDRCLTIAPYHEEARNSIEYVKAKQGLNRPVESETIPLLTPGKAQGVKETLKQLLAQHETKSAKKAKKKKDKKVKRKKNRSSSSSSSSSLSSSSSSSSSSSETSSASSQDSHHKRKHKRKGEHKDRSLSPLSKRMALMDSVGSVEAFDGGMAHKGSHYNPPSMPFSFTMECSVISGQPDLANTSATGAAAGPGVVGGLSAKSSVESEYEARVRKFLEQTKGRKERKAHEEKKKKKKKDKKASKKNRKKKREERKKLKKAAKEEKMRREGKRRRSNSNIEDDDLYGSKNDIRLISFDNIPDLEDLQSKLSAYYAKVEKAPKK